MVEVRVALPEGGCVTVVDARESCVVAFVRGAAPGQPVTVREPDGRGGGVVGSPVPPVADGVAPATGRIPVPGLYPEFSAEADRGHRKSNRLHRLDVRGGVDVGDHTLAVSVETGAEGRSRVESVHRGALRMHGDHGALHWCLGPGDGRVSGRVGNDAGGEDRQDGGATHGSATDDPALRACGADFIRRAPAIGARIEPRHLAVPQWQA